MELSVYVLAIGDYSDCIEKALQSVKKADEIIVQTGKDKKTIEIAKKYTKKVFTDFKWNESGADARNHAIKKCKGNWILEMDVDNWLEEGGIDKIRKTIKSGIADVYNLRYTNGFNYHFFPGLFKNIPQNYYVGAVHEVLTNSTKVNLDVSVFTGVSKKRLSDPERNIRRLKSVLDENPNLTREKFYLGREYYDQGYYLNALYWLNKYIPESKWLPELAEAYYYKALALWRMKEGSKARESCLHAIEINANMRKALELMAEMSWPKNKQKWLEFAKLATNEDVVFV